MIFDKSHTERCAGAKSSAHNGGAVSTWTAFQGVGEMQGLCQVPLVCAGTKLSLTRALLMPLACQRMAKASRRCTSAVCTASFSLVACSSSHRATAPCRSLCPVSQPPTKQQKSQATPQLATMKPDMQARHQALGIAEPALLLRLLDMRPVTGQMQSLRGRAMQTHQN